MPPSVDVTVTMLEMAVCKGGNVQTDTQMVKSKGRDHCCATGRKETCTMQTLWTSTQGKISKQWLSHTLGLGSWDALRQCKVPGPRYWTYWFKKYILVCVILCPLKAPFPPPGGGWIMSLELYPRIHAPNTRDFGCTQHLLAITRSLWAVFAFSLWVLSRLAFFKVFCCIWFYSLS